ncbi:C-X-C motif chemokine 10 isoform X3 [Gadus morhua]|uniref:C-X-C motif chemokine 10 isoform X3 n=1 Tax=Gadus morhua TaxID=8049 RepID=UPI0011B75C15|nr:C-X-C motif chemokine 10-like isoform X3 [Gadus morhua]
MKATMFSLIKVLLLLSLLASLSSAQRPQTSRCLCSRFQRYSGDAQRFDIYNPYAFCDKLEIVVTRKDGEKFCVNPNSKGGRYLQKKKSTTQALQPPLSEE